MATYLNKPFAIAQSGTIISGEAGKKIYVLAIHMTNISVHQTVYLKSGGYGGDYIYGNAWGAIYLQEKGQFELPIDKKYHTPWFITGTGEELYLDPTHGTYDKQITGVVTYYIE